VDPRAGLDAVANTEGSLLAPVGNRTSVVQPKPSYYTDCP